MLALASSLAGAIGHQGAGKHWAFLPWGRHLTCWKWSGPGRRGNLCTLAMLLFLLSPPKKKSVWKASCFGSAESFFLLLLRNFSFLLFPLCFVYLLVEVRRHGAEDAGARSRAAANA